MVRIAFNTVSIIVILHHRLDLQMNCAIARKTFLLLGRIRIRHPSVLVACVAHANIVLVNEYIMHKCT